MHIRYDWTSWDERSKGEAPKFRMFCIAAMKFLFANSFSDQVLASSGSSIFEAFKGATLWNFSRAPDRLIPSARLKNRYHEASGKRHLTIINVIMIVEFSNVPPA